MTQPGAPAGPVTEKHVRPRAILVMVPWLPTTQAARRVWAAPRRMVVAETVEAKLNEVGGDLTSSAPRPNFLHLGLSLSLAGNKLPAIGVRNSNLARFGREDRLEGRRTRAGIHEARPSLTDRGTTTIALRVASQEG
jgi:hypothetical protein